MQKAGFLTARLILSLSALFYDFNHSFFRCQIKVVCMHDSVYDVYFTNIFKKIMAERGVMYLKL